MFCPKLKKRSDIRSDTVGTDGNNAHLFVDAATKHSPSEIFRIVKSIAAREFFIKFPEIKRDLRGGEFWNGGDIQGQLVKEELLISSENTYCAKFQKMTRKIIDSSNCFQSARAPLLAVCRFFFVSNLISDDKFIFTDDKIFRVRRV